MQRLIELLKRFRFFFLFIFLEVISISFLVYYNSYQHAVFFNFLQHISGNVYTKIDNTRRFFHLRHINDSLLIENARLQSQINSIYLKEKNFHSGIFDTNSKLKYIYQPAYVINNSVDRRKNFLVLNIGSKQGIEKNMSVITSQGIAGIIKDVSENYSLVISVLNSDFRLNAKIVETNDIGSIIWDGPSADIVVLKDIPNQNLIRKGNHVVVGPYSQSFPENIPIGIIESIKLDKGGSFYNINVRLTSSMRNVMNVYVVKNLNISEPFNLQSNTEQ